MCHSNVGGFGAESVCTRRTAITARRPHGSISGNNGPNDSADFPTSEAKAQPNRADAKVYMGTIVNTGNSYVLKSANEEYLLDSQTKAKKYQGKDVQVTGTLDKEKKLIHVKQIKVSPSM